MEPGLLEAAKEGHEDALIDLAYFFMEQGNPRGLDILWDRCCKADPTYTLGKLSREVCPICASRVVHMTLQEDGTYRCGDWTLEMHPDGEVKTTDTRCGWVGCYEDLLPPVFEEKPCLS